MNINRYIITTNCQRGSFASAATFAELAIQLENGGHKITAIQQASHNINSTSRNEHDALPAFRWDKTEEPQVPRWKYRFSSGDKSIHGKTVIAESYHKAAASLGCRVQFAIPFSAHCSSPSGKPTLIDWGLDPVE